MSCASGRASASRFADQSIFPTTTSPEFRPIPASLPRSHRASTGSSSFTIQLRIANEAALLTALRAVGGIKADAVDFAELPYIEHIRTVLEARVLIGVGGAGLTNLLWLSPESGVVELFRRTGGRHVSATWPRGAACGTGPCTSKPFHASPQRNRTRSRSLPSTTGRRGDCVRPVGFALNNGRHYLRGGSLKTRQRALTAARRQDPRSWRRARAALKTGMFPRASKLSHLVARTEPPKEQCCPDSRANRRRATRWPRARAGDRTAPRR